MGARGAGEKDQRCGLRGGPCWWEPPVVKGQAGAVSSPGRGWEAAFGLGHPAAMVGFSQLTGVVSCHPSQPVFNTFWMSCTMPGAESRLSWCH